MKEKMLKDTIRKIERNYRDLEASLVNQLNLETPNHQYTTGTYREIVWKGLFEMMIPKKYCIEQGIFIIDSYGNMSKEVDLAVLDETYTPYIFNFGKIKFIPIEAVSVVIQCKSKVQRESMKIDLKEWGESIDALKTSLDSVSRTISELVDNNDIKLALDKVRNGMTQTSTRPIKILCATGISNPIKKSLADEFDIFLYIKEKHLIKDINRESIDFLQWNDLLNHSGYGRYSEEEEEYRKLRKKDRTGMKSGESIGSRNLSDLRVTNQAGDENIILSLTFQLNQLLMLINNPMLFPHRAYAKCFTRILDA